MPIHGNELIGLAVPVTRRARLTVERDLVHRQYRGERVGSLDTVLLPTPQRTLHDKLIEQIGRALAAARAAGTAVQVAELADHFAHSQLYPWHLESACEWLERKGRIGKFSAPFGLTKMSRVEVEEPAYLCEEE